jgi:ribose-phosphate pyrophosphokinase
MIIDLTNLENSKIKYKISQFPDGQQNITLLPLTQSDKFNIRESSVTIKSRLNSFKDLELIIATVACLREKETEHIHLYVPYFMGARSDRKFEDGGNNYLKDVICPIINSLNLDSVETLDPHSHVLEALIRNFKSKSNLDLVRFAITDLYKLCDDSNSDNFVIISPDAGAYHKIYKLTKEIGYEGDIITCTKERDTEGNLTKTFVPLPYQKNNGEYLAYRDKDYIIIDDICDGGRTFINIVKELTNSGVTGKIYLIVTHGIFSAGFYELSKHFNKIYCTNSYSDVLKGSYYHYDNNNLVNQLNIF